MASIPQRCPSPCWARCQFLSRSLVSSCGVFFYYYFYFFYLLHARSLKRLCSWGIWGQPGPGLQAGGGKCRHLAVLPPRSSSESFPCLFIFGVYLFTTEVSAQSRLAVPNSSGGIVAAASSIQVLLRRECSHPEPRGREVGLL